MEEYSIKELLSENGYEPVYRRTEYGMYLSPLRDEKDPSFKVDYIRNLWYDFGMGRGGNAVSLYMLLKNCSLQQARESLSQSGRLSSFPKREIPSLLKVQSPSILHSPSLLSYLDERKIPSYLARAYCYELTVVNGSKQHIAIGFRNDMGGWEIRNRYLKLSTSPKTVSTYTDPKREICNVFEGFMDYLSLLSLSGNTGIRGTSIILNSVVNLPKTFNMLQTFDNILCYFDNDKAGRETYQVVKNRFLGINVEDCSIYYRGYKDLNDCLTGKKMTISKEEKEIGQNIHVGL